MFPTRGNCYFTFSLSVRCLNTIRRLAFRKRAHQKTSYPREGVTAIQNSWLNFPFQVTSDSPPLSFTQSIHLKTDVLGLFLRSSPSSFSDLQSLPSSLTEDSAAMAAIGTVLDRRRRPTPSQDNVNVDHKRSVENANKNIGEDESGENANMNVKQPNSLSNQNCDHSKSSTFSVFYNPNDPATCPELFLNSRPPWLLQKSSFREKWTQWQSPYRLLLTGSVVTLMGILHLRLNRFVFRHR